MTTISEAITTIKKAENDADSLIADAKQKSADLIEESHSKAEEAVEKASVYRSNEYLLAVLSRPHSTRVQRSFAVLRLHYPRQEL